MNNLFTTQRPLDKAKPERQAPEKSLIHAHGIRVGQAVEWAHGNAPAEITEPERRAIRAALGVKRINEPRCMAVKRCMVTMTCAQIVRHFGGRRGFSVSWITKVHAALSRR